MEERNRPPRPVNPRRRRKTKMQIFKEAYLPAIIAGAALIFILVCIVGSIVRSVEKGKLDKQAQQQAQQQAQMQADLEKTQVQQLLTQAQLMAEGYDYDGVIAMIDGFTGDISRYPELSALKESMTAAKDDLVAWSDPAQIPNLSLQMLIADPQRAFNDDKFTYSFTRNFLTCQEFSVILERLYAEGYVLVNLSDVYTDQSGGFSANTIYLPEGKKPLILTQTNVNYHTYLTDSDGDKLPDSGGCGFASKLIFDENGALTCEYVDAANQIVTGDYDMIPILNRFVAGHPDFSYRGAKAVIALTAYDGLFGYRTNAAAEQYFGTQVFEQEIAAVRQIADKLIADGYELACYTYENKAYGNFTTEQLQQDLNGWLTDGASILDNITIFAYAQNSDIGQENTLYNDERLTALTDAGFRIFLGFSAGGNKWSITTDSYVRQGRILLSPTNIKYHPDWFGNIFDANTVLDASRGEIPT